MFEAIYPFLYLVYTQILLLWTGVFQSLVKHSSNVMKVLRHIIVGSMLVVPPFSFGIIITKGLRVNDLVWYMVGWIIVATAIFLLTVAFVVFGVLILNYVKRL